jgi:sulfur-oxidizing protein SoxY
MATIAKQLTGGTPPMDPYRRRLIAGAGVAGVAGVLSIIPLASVAATPAQLKTALEMITGGATVTPGRVKLEIAPLVESGFTVPCKVSVASTMKGADRVQAIHILNQKNPQPNVINARLGPRAAKAQFGTRIRLADSQTVMAVAEFSDGSFWSDQVDVVVTLGACVEEAL